MMTGPMVLSANQPARRPYRGGPQIAAFRGTRATGDDIPEDWIASTTPLFGHDRLGLSELPDGRLLADAIRADPVWWLGREHVDAFGADPLLLTKLLDAGERLFVHAHPDDAFAAAHGFANGKAEAWFVLSGGTVRLGLRESIGTEDLLQLAMDQDVEVLLSLLHEVQVEPGDVVAVPPGVLHAIGAGVFVVELQQAADLSILLEWQGFPIDGLADGNLGLGLDLAIQAVETRGRRDVTDLIRTAGFGPSVLPAVMDAWVRLERHAVTTPTVLEQGFGVLISVAGEVTAQDTRLLRGTTAVVPFAAGPVELTGDGEVLVARPPSP